MARRIKKLDEGTVELRFSPNFYLKSCIIDAAKDFGDACNCKVKDWGKDIVVTMHGMEGLDAERMGHEFSNYVLGLMKNRGEV